MILVALHWCVFEEVCTLSSIYELILATKLFASQLTERFKVGYLVGNMNELASGVTGMGLGVSGIGLEL